MFIGSCELSSLFFVFFFLCCFGVRGSRLLRGGVELTWRGLCWEYVCLLGAVCFSSRYYEGGVSSVYFWDLDEGFAGVVLLKKSEF